MRVREGHLSYEIQLVRDPATMLLSHFRVLVVDDSSGMNLVEFEGTAKSIDEATQIGERELDRRHFIKRAA